MVTLGRPVFETLDFIRFPSETIHDNQWIIAPPTGKKISDELAGMPFCRPSNLDLRQCTYPCVLTNTKGSKQTQIKIQPLIGTADDGLYLRESDIKRLGLRFTGRSEYTRQGACVTQIRRSRAPQLPERL
ncbi:hypothetical protein EV122DRAFT_260044, partial [Schizophyllum commune]